MNETNRPGPPGGETPLEPQLEARLVAWIAGEASPFEAAELARLVAERPEVARGKRELEAAHALVGAAARPDAKPLRLSAERRAKLLAMLAGSQGSDAAPKSPSSNVSEPRGRRRAWRTQPWLIGLAACAAFGMFVAFEVRTSDIPATRPAPIQLQRVAAEAKTLGLNAEVQEAAAKAVVDRESAAKAAKEMSRRRSDIGSAASNQITMPTMPTMPFLQAQGAMGPVAFGTDSATKLQSKADSASAPKTEETVTLSPFEVRPQKDLRFGTRASNYIGGTATLGGAAGSVTLGAPAASSPTSGGLALSAVNESALLPRQEADIDSPKAKAPAAPLPAPVESAVAKEAVSTFSLHVSDVSFRLAQTALARGMLPDAATVRPEEFYNAFRYDDPAPTEAEKIACRIEQSAHPFLAGRNLARIALQVATTGRGVAQPLRLTVLVDTSGSMEREDRVAIVQRALTALGSLLGPEDRLTLIGFARQPRLLADALPGNRAGEALEALARTPAEGGTNFEAALALAAERALRSFQPGAQNRVVLLTDGAANLGNAVPEQLARIAARLRQRGIALDACGVGLDGLDDAMLETLTRQSDGRYLTLNSPEEADAGFAQKLAGAFRPAAENVKVQVRFNPARVATYRLIGFERHRLREQDFRDDRVDAAELAADEAGVAVYQFEPLPQGDGDIGEILVRFRDPASGTMVERTWRIPYEPRAPAFDRAAPSLQLAGVAALLAEKLRADAHAAQIPLRDLAAIANALPTHFADEPRVRELATMFSQARRILGDR